MTDDIQTNSGRHFAGTMTRLAVQQVERALGAPGVERLLAASQLEQPLETLLDDASWFSYGELRRLLDAAAVLLGGVDQLAGLGVTATITAGSMPDATDALQSLGSTSALLQELNGGNSGLSTIERGGWTEQLGPTEWLLARRLDEGFEPFESLCAFHRGLASMIPLMFGCTDVRVEDVSCQCQGDEWCVVRLT